MLARFRPISSLSILSFLSMACAPALAQPPSGPPDRVETRAVPLGADGSARLLSTWAADPARSGLSLRLGDREPVALARGNAAGAIEVDRDVVVVAYAVEDRRSPFRVRLVRRDGARYALGEAHEITRPGDRHEDQPFSVAIAPLADGFAIFFQEVQTDDPSAAHTYLVKIDRDGSTREAAREVPVPWSLAAAAWNGSGYHLALYFPGYGDGMRLSMVSLSADGQPQQHPDWASAAGYVADVHLVARDGHVRAFYRGGSGGDRLLESDVTEIRSWGQEPPHARDHGELSSDAAILVSASGTARSLS